MINLINDVDSDSDKEKKKYIMLANQLANLCRFTIKGMNIKGSTNGEAGLAWIIKLIECNLIERVENASVNDLKILYKALTHINEALEQVILDEDRPDA